MALSDILNKMSPVGNKITRDMSESEYMRLVDRNTELFDENKELHEEAERLNNIINKIEEHFVFLKMNSTGGNKEFFEDILDFIKAIKELKGSNKQ